MKNAYHHPSAGTGATGISLQRLVGLLVDHSQRHHSCHRNSITNEVHEGFMVIGDESKLSPVIHDLLATIVMNARNGDIHITAERFNDTATLQIQDRNSYNGYAVASRLHCLEADVLRMGGHIDHQGKNQLVSTICFSFPNHS